MKTALIAAGTLATATVAGLSGASAKDVNFALTFGGPQGYVQIASPGTYYGPNYVHKVHKKKKKHKHKRKHAKRYWKGAPGYTYGYWAPYPVPRPRAYGYCASPYQIKARLRRHGWYGFNIRKTTPRFVFVTSYKYGAKYRLKVDRCSGHIAHAKPLGGYQYGIYW